MKNINVNEIKRMEENDKIVFITEHVLGAVNEKTAVTMEQIIEKGIELGVTEDYPRGKEDGHPWFPRTSVMMGVGSKTAVESNEQLHLHRKKMKKTSGGTAMFYWVDWKNPHEHVTRFSDAEGTKKVSKKESVKPVVVESRVIHQTFEQMKEKVSQHPDQFRMVNGKLISESWLQSHPDKALKLYGIQVTN